ARRAGGVAAGARGAPRPAGGGDRGARRPALGGGRRADGRRQPRGRDARAHHRHPPVQAAGAPRGRARARARAARAHLRARRRALRPAAGRPLVRRPAGADPRTALVVRDLGVWRGAPPGGFALRVPALDLRRGEVLAVLGANGAGKSTLLHALAGLLPPRAGAVTRLAPGAPGLV